MPDLIRNERLKLSATWLNNTAVAVMSVGVLGPIALFMYRSSDGPLPDSEAIGKGMFVCFGISVFLHLLGRRALGGLDDDDADE